MLYRGCIDQECKATFGLNSNIPVSALDFVKALSANTCMEYMFGSLTKGVFKYLLYFSKNSDIYVLSSYLSHYFSKVS